MKGRVEIMKKNSEKLKAKLEKLVQQALENGGEVYIKSGDILISENGYSDERTIFDQERQLHVVKPIAFLNWLYSYVCPDCGEIHLTYNVGKIQTGCCLDIDCERVQYIDGQHYLIKRKAIILDDEDVEEC